VSRNEDLAIAYLRILASFSLGILRTFRAKFTTSSVAFALGLLNSSEGPIPGGAPIPDDAPAGQALRMLQQIPFRHFDSFMYVSQISLLVYATTLLDTYVSDTTKFLLLLHPGAIGKDHQVSLAAILEAPSTTGIIETAASKKVRELGYIPFPARIEFLRQAFGLGIQLRPEAEAALEHYPTIRNTLVHDQGVFAVTLAPDGTPLVEQKTCPSHPTPLKSEDLDHAIDSYCEIAIAIAKAILTQVFNLPDHPAYDSAFEGLLPGRDGIAAPKGSP